MSSEAPEISQIQASVDSIFTYLPAYNVLICRGCGYGVHFGQVIYHLTSKHTVRPETRTKISEYIKDHYSGSARLPTRKIEKISELPVHLGFKCNLGCNYICGPDKSTIAGHLKGKHDWINPIRRGKKGRKNVAPPPTAYTTNVPCQRFFIRGNQEQAYFEVSDSTTNAGTRDTQDLTLLDDDNDDDDDDGNGNGNEPTDTLALFDRRLLVNLKKYDEKAAIITEPLPLDAAQWVKRTGWAAHLTAFDLETATSWLDLPEKPKDPATRQEYLDFGLHIIKDRVSSLFTKALKASHTVGITSRFYVNRKETGAEGNSKPFDPNFGAQTVNDYTRVWFQVFTYIWNTRDLLRKPQYTLWQKKSGPLFTEIRSISEHIGKR